MNLSTTTAVRPRLGHRCLGLAGALGLLLAAGVSAHPHAEPSGDEPHWDSPVLELGALSDLERLVEALRDTRVVLVGETHDRYEHHLNQLAIIRGIYEQDPRLAIGLEFFQQPFQEYLDQFVAGEIDEREFLRGTEYFQRWRFDYRLYRPILDFARERGLPLVALNVPGEVTSKVARQGLESLDEEQQQWVPAEIERGNTAYEERLREVYEQHPSVDEGGFERFLDAQLLWDEGMAERAARYLEDHPEQRMVILAGAGHLEYGDGIPDRLQRRLGASQAVVINGLRDELDPDLADYLLLPEPRELPPAGFLGVRLASGAEGPQVQGFVPDSPAREAGVRKLDRILRIDGEEIGAYSDIRLALMGRAPGDRVQVEVERQRLFFGSKELSFEIELQ